MKCAFCGGATEFATDIYVARRGSCVIVVKNVPVIVCRECGEKSFSGEVFEKLEKLVDIVVKTCTDVAVTDYSKTVA